MEDLHAQFDDKLASLGGSVFDDPEFKPCKESLIKPANASKKPGFEKDIEWMRATDIDDLKGEDLELFKDGVEPGDIKQGSLGDCYFLSALAAMAEFPVRIEKMFAQTERNASRMYGIIMCKNGQRQIVYVDNYIPTKNGKLAFSQTHGKEMWAVMLEKAWAKIHGSYERIVAGDTQTTLRDLTGAPGDTLDFKDKDLDEIKIWNKLKEADEANYIICASIDGRSEAEKAKVKEIGLVCGHAYTLIQVYEFDDVRLCKIRNPWGSFEWKGDWSDKSDLWTDQLRDAVGFTDEDDGIFFMSWEDVAQYFSRFSINRYRDNNNFVSTMFRQKPEGFSFAKLNISKRGTHTISVSQRGERMFDRDADYKYSCARLIVAKLNDGQGLDGGVTYIQGGIGCMIRDTHVDVNLEKGVYGVFAEVDWEENCYKGRNYCITRYGPGEDGVEDCTGEYAKTDVLFECLRSAAEQGIGKITEKTLESDGAPGIQVMTINDQAHFFAHYVINEEASAKYKCETKFSDCTGVTMLEPYAGTTEFDLMVEPGSEGMAIMKKCIRQFGYSKSTNEQAIFGKETLIKKAMEEGEKKERCPGIYQYYLKHSGGLFFVYTNESDKTLVETLTFNITGLTIVGHDSNVVEVRCAPGEMKDVELKKDGGGWTFGLSTSIMLE